MHLIVSTLVCMKISKHRRILMKTHHCASEIMDKNLEIMETEESPESQILDMSLASALASEVMNITFSSTEKHNKLSDESFEVKVPTFHRAIDIFMSHKRKNR